MRSVQGIGLKITAAQREYFRYTDASAALERRGAGTSRPDLACLSRSKQKGWIVDPAPAPTGSLGGNLANNHASHLTGRRG